MPGDNTPFFLANPVTTGFFINDPFNSPRPYANGRHEGIDLRAVRTGGEPVEVVAAQRGVVDRIKTGDTGYGNYVRLRHDWPDGVTWYTWYAHLGEILSTLATGQTVELGQRLGLAGTSGSSTGVHLHLTLQRPGGGLDGYVIADVVDPAGYFRDVTVPVVDEMTCVGDVTAPDGTTVEAGQPFTKTWRVRNSGASTWTNCTLEHYSDERMDGPGSAPLPALKPGEIGEVSVPLVAPAAPGRHRSTWKARNGRGRLFAFELYVDVVVSPVSRRDDAVFVAHVTLPPGASLEAGQTALKTWRVRNTGDTTWETGYTLAHTAGDPLAAGEARATGVPTTRPGATADLSVSITAPAAAGNYRAIWQLWDATGRPFGEELAVELRITAAQPAGDDATSVAEVTIPDGQRMAPASGFTKTWRVRNTGSTTWGDGYSLAFAGDNPMSGPAAVALPPAAPGQVVEVSVPLVAPAGPGRHRSAWQPRTPDGAPFGDILDVVIEVVRLGTLDNAAFVADATFPDGTVVNGGARLEKTWRVRNVGSSAWGAGYALVFVANNQMNGPDSAPLPEALPGETVEVTVPLRAPLAPGIHRSTWRPRNPAGQLFGDLLYAEIRVPVSSTPGATALDDAQLDAHVTIPDGSEIAIGETFQKTWAIRNTGSIPWSTGYELVYVGGAQLGETTRVAVTNVPPQGVATVSVELTAPIAPGRAIGRWRMRNARGEFFGSTLFVSIVVVESPAKYDLLPYLCGDGRLYEMKYIFDMPAGPMVGQQRLQTQTDGTRFYQTKNNEWEELWADARFIYRGTDTSPGSGNFYSLMDGERYGAVWAPRQMAVGQFYRRSVLVVSRRKGNCMMNASLSGRHVTWIRLESIQQECVLPDTEGRPGRGLRLKDVIALAAYGEVDGRPAAQPFERYYYAKGFGLIMWEGIATDHKGVSFAVQLHNSGDRPDNVRERIPCWEALQGEKR